MRTTWNPEAEYVWPAHGLGALTAQFDHYCVAIVNKKPMFMPAMYNPRMFQGKRYGKGPSRLFFEPPEFVGNMPGAEGPKRELDNTTSPSIPPQSPLVKESLQELGMKMKEDNE